jgi:thiamine pyrophosphokinase
MSEIKAVILCDGRKPPKSKIIACAGQADLFIAADGGANIAHKLGLIPDFIIGDLDSYSPITGMDESVTVIRDSDQETNDLEKALTLAIDHEVSSTHVFGAFGRRPDHALKNLSVLKKFNNRFTELKFIDNYGEMFLLPKKFTTSLPAGIIVSLIPLSGTVEGITTTGLKYSLQNEPLTIGLRDGTSNETVDEIIEITYEKGDLLFFITSKNESH